MKTIVIGYDGSDEAKDALSLAADLRTATRAHLIVSPIDEIEPYWGDLNLEQLNEERNHYFRRMFDEVAEQIGDSDFKQVPGAGSAPAALDQIAEVEKPDVVVVGSTHRAGIATVLPGSTADRLLSGASCAIAVAPRGYAKERDHSVQHIGVAYDGQRESDLALDVAIETARQVGGDLRLIAVNKNSSLDSYFDETIAAGLKRVPQGISSSSVIALGQPEEELAKEGAKLDLLVIGSRGYGPVRRVLLGGIAQRVINTATCPVMVVPRGVEAAPSNAKSHWMEEVVI